MSAARERTDPQGGKREISLLLHHYPRAISRSDFDGIAERIHARAPDIHVEVLGTDRPHVIAALRAARRPTVSVEFNRAKFFRCLRGRVFRQWRTGKKSDQYRLLEAAGLPVPKWAPITPGIVLDPSQWGEHVVEKPDHGQRGAYVRVKRTRRVRYRGAEDLQDDNPGRSGGMIAQKLVYSGNRPVSYRVQTFFGTPLHARSHQGNRGQLYSDEADGSRKFLGASVVATGVGCQVALIEDADVLDLARRVHDVFPDLPVLGIDIVRDIDDGSLWILEVNPDGGTWSLASPGGRRMMSHSGLDFHAQFGALDLAAETLIDLCRREAV